MAIWILKQRLYLVGPSCSKHPFVDSITQIRCRAGRKKGEGSLCREGGETLGYSTFLRLVCVPRSPL